MAETTTLNIRIDRDLKERAEAVFADMGMNMTTAINLFVRQTLRQGKIPFEIYADPFYSEGNQRALRASLEQARQGRTVTRSLDELERLADGD